MATGLATATSVGTTEQGPLIVLSVAFAGPDVPGGRDDVQVFAQILATDGPAAVRSKMSAAIVSEALARGYSVVPTELTIPTFQKGV